MEVLILICYEKHAKQENANNTRHTILRIFANIMSTSMDNANQKYTINNTNYNYS